MLGISNEKRHPCVTDAMRQLYPNAFWRRLFFSPMVCLYTGANSWYPAAQLPESEFTEENKALAELRFLAGMQEGS